MQALSGLQSDAEHAWSQWEALRRERPPGDEPSAEELAALGSFIRADQKVQGAERVAGALGYVQPGQLLPDSLFSEGLTCPRPPRRRPRA